MKIAIVGSRNFKNLNLVKDETLKIFCAEMRAYRPIFISGGAKGVDITAEQTIDFANLSYNPELDRDSIKKIIFKPDWDKYGKQAGFLRNKQIVDEADKLIAFWDGKSKGTKHTIDLAIAAGKPVDIFIRN